MSERLYTALLEQEKDLVQEVVNELHGSTAEAYAEMDLLTLNKRVEALVSHLLKAIRDCPVEFVRYIAEIAEARIAESFMLEEILLALRVLEEKVWLKTTSVMELEDQIMSLQRISSTIGGAKDRLAVIYVRRAEGGMRDGTEGQEP